MIFTIKAGRHRANHWFRWRILWGNTLRFRYRLHQDAAYDERKVLNGWSKLFGVASPLVHRNSIRVVWKSTRSGLKAGLYAYCNGVSPQRDAELKQEIGSISPGLWYEAAMMCEGGRWYIHHGSEGIKPDVYIYQRSGWKLPVHFICHPYVGGLFTLDNDIGIEVEKVK
jgi:hypothetical protein